TIVTADRRTLTQIAVQSTSGSWKKKAVSLQDRAALVANQEGAHRLRGVGTRRRPENDAALLHPGVHLERDGPETPAVLDRRCNRQRQGDDPYVRRARLHELKR